MISLLLLSAAGCDPLAESRRSTPRSAATILLADEPRGVNYLVSGGGRSTADLIDRLFLHLFEERPDFSEHPPTFAPRLAESWIWSDDGLRLALQLRKNVHWTDGAPLTAQDVRWTWLAQVDEAVGWPYADLKAPIRDVRVIDDHRLEVDFSQRTPDMLAILNEGAILPRHAWGRLPFSEWHRRADWFLDNLVTAGPFLLDSWESQQELVLSRNDSYYEAGLPRLERVVLRIVPLRQNRLAALTIGAADFVAQLTPAEAEEMGSAPRARVRQFWHRQYDYLAWNLRRRPLGDAAVRRGLTQAIDRGALIEALWGGLARASVSPIPTSTWAWDASVEPWPCDRAAAIDAFTGAGWLPDDEGRLRRDGQPFALEILVNSGNPIHVDAAVLIQDQLRRVGVGVDVRRLDFHALIARFDAGDFDAAIGSWGIDTSLDVGYAFHSRSIGAGYNSGGYSNPAVDRLIDAARLEVDFEARRLMLHELQRLIHIDQPYTFLWEPPRFDAHSLRLEGVDSNPLSSLYRLREWSIAED